MLYDSKILRCIEEIGLSIIYTVNVLENTH